MFNHTFKAISYQVIFAGLVAAWSTAVFADSVRRDVHQGNRFFRDGNFQASQEKYRAALEARPESDIINFNLGTALYKQGDYQGAIDRLEKSLLTDDKKLKQKAHYNLGNSLYQNGLKQEPQDISAAVESLEKSIQQYQSALSMDARDDDAQHNFAFVSQELKKLKLKKQQMPNTQQQKFNSSGQKKEQQSQGASENENSSDASENQAGAQQRQQQDQQNPSENKTEDQSGSEQKGEEGPQDKDQSENKDEPQEGDNQKPRDGENPGQQDGQSGNEDYNDKQSDQGQPLNPDELTDKEAQMLLDGYLQEEPQGLLNFNNQTRDTRPVLKDW